MGKWRGECRATTWEHLSVCLYAATTVYLPPLYFFVISLYLSLKLTTKVKCSKEQPTNSKSLIYYCFHRADRHIQATSKTACALLRLLARRWCRCRLFFKLLLFLYSRLSFSFQWIRFIRMRTNSEKWKSVCYIRTALKKYQKKPGTK